MAMGEFRCQNCGSNECILNEVKGVKKCRYCGTEYQDADVGFEVKSIYEKIDLKDFKSAGVLCSSYLSKAPKNATYHWLMFQIKKNIFLVKDPDTGELKPTFTSETFTRDCVYDDENYKLALEYASEENRKTYKTIADRAEAIRLELNEECSQKENYDVFISFKSTRNVIEEGSNSSIKVDTRDRQIARDVYKHLTEQGYRVFFSDVVLGKDKTKVGELYEPTIFAALASCRAMVLIGTKAEYIDKDWVKDEWTRYLYFMSITGNKDSRLKKKEGTLFYVFDDPNDNVPPGLPYEIASLQGLNYDKREEFYESLLYAIKSKIGNGANRANIATVQFTEVVGKKAKTANVDSLGTVELGSGNAAPRQQKKIEGNLAVKKFGLNKVRKVDSSIEKELQAIAAGINNGRFSWAQTRIDNILSEGDNAEAYFYKIICSIEAKNPEDFVDNSSRFDDFELFEKALDCSDVETANRLIDMFVRGFEECFNDRVYSSAANYFRQLTKFDTTQRQEVVLIMQQKIVELISQGALEEDIIELIDAYLKSIDPRNVDKYIEECLNFAHASHQNGYLKIAERYMHKVKEIDEGNPEVTMFNILLQTGSTSPDQLVDNLCKINDLNDIVNLIKNSSSEQASMCMQIFVEGVKKALQTCDYSDSSALVKPLEIFKTLLTFNFDGRDEAKKEVLDVLCDYVAKSSNYDKDFIADFVEYLLKATSSENVDEHIYINKEFAIALRESGNFELSKKYINKVLELDNTDIEARYNMVLALSECSKDNLGDKIALLGNEEGEVIIAIAELLNYSYHVNATGKYSYVNLINLFTNTIFDSLDSKKCLISEADAAYCNIVKYIQDTEKELRVERLQKMGEYLIKNREFTLAAKYFKMLLEDDPNNFDARWSCVLIELGCLTDLDVLASTTLIENCAQYDDALSSASPEKQAYLFVLASKQELLAENSELTSTFNEVVSSPYLKEEEKQILVTCPKDDFEIEIKNLYSRVLKLKKDEEERIRKEAEAERKRREEEAEKLRKERERRHKEAQRARREVTAKAVSKFFLVFVLLIGAVAGFGSYLTFGLVSGDFTQLEFQNIIVMATCVVIAIISFISYVKSRSSLVKLEILVYEILTLIELIIFGMFISDSIILSLIVAGISISALCVYIKCKNEVGSNCISVFFINLIATIIISLTYFYLKKLAINFSYEDQIYAPILAILIEIAMYVLSLVYTSINSIDYEGGKAFASVMAYLLYSIAYIGFSSGILSAGYTAGKLGNPTFAIIPWLIVLGGTSITSITLFLYDMYMDQVRIAWLSWMFFTIFEVLSFILGIFVLQEYNTVFENLVALAGVIFGFVMMSIKNYHDEWKKSIIWLLLPFILLFVVAIFGAIGQACSSSCGSSDDGSGSSGCGSCDGCGSGCGGCGGGVGGIVFVILIIIGIFKSKKD